MGVRQAALAVVAVVVAAANNGVEAARYEDNLLTEFTFSQAECKSRAFADSVTANYLGGLTYPSGWATLTKCPTYTDADGTVFDYAYNGMHSVGARYLASGSGTNLTLDDSAKSTSTVSSLLTELDGVTDFTLEFWIRPSFSYNDGTSNQYVALEVGNEKDSSTVGDSYTWACTNSNRNYGMQLLYNEDANRFELEYRRGSADSECTTLEFDSTSIAAGKLYHVLLIGSYNAGSDLFTANLQVHAEDESINSSNNQVSTNEISFSNFDSAHVLRLGSSPATLSSSTSGGIPDYHSFPGDILHFSFYNESLGATEIADNFAAKTLNSGPVPANDVVRQTFSEDDFTAVDLTKAVFDFDDVFFSTESMTYTLTSSTNGDFLGNTFRYNSNVVTPSTSINPAVADLEWRNAITDDWGWSNTTFFTVTGSDGSMTSAAATLSPEAVGTNDAPEQTVGTETAAHTPQAGAQLLTFSVTDADCATRGVQYSDGALDTQDETLLDNSCTNLGGISNVTILAPADAVKLGVLFYPNNLLECTPYDSSTMTEITVDTTFTESDEEWNEVSDGVVEVSLCFEACLSYAGSENPCPAGVDGGASAILGNSTFQFYGTDQITDGPTGTVTTTVTNVLTMTEQTNLITYEETALEITLSGSDEFCERFNSSLCPRAKSFLIDSLPLASEGIFYLDEELTTPLVEGEMYAGADSATLKVYLMPGKDYFSANEWPICGPAISTESNPVSAWSFSFCINEDDGIDTFPCEGPLCNGWYNTMPAAFGDALTTADLEGNAMGGCGADVSVGCPVELMVSLVVGNLTSEPLAGASVHVINVNDEPEIIIPAANLSDVVRAVDTPVSWTDANGDPTYIYISDSDGDARWQLGMWLGFWLDSEEKRGLLA